MNKQPELFFVTGELSGDIHAAGLACELAGMADVRLTGAGGQHMREAGVATDFDSTGWGAIGLPQAVRKIPYLLLQKKRIVNMIKQRQPALLILIDFGAFNVRLARTVRQACSDQRIMYYFPPSSWRRRAHDWSFLDELVDMVATPFKWSAQQLRNCGVAAHWVGHPVVDRFSDQQEAADFRRQQSLPDGDPVVGLMPGSRDVERNCIGPQLLAAAKLLHSKLPDAQFLWSELSAAQPSKLDRRAAGADYVTPLADSRSLILASDIVVTASGTATLEATAALRPLIMVYRGTLAMQIQARFMDFGTDYFAMPNIIAGRYIIPELIQNEVNPERLCKEVLDLHNSESHQEQMKQELTEVRAELGPPGAARRAAQLALALIADQDKLPSVQTTAVGEALR